MTKFYEIKSREEAMAYMQDDMLRTRYLNCCQAIFDSNKSIHEIFGRDAIKIRASLLLMNSIWDDIRIKQLLIKHCWI